MTTVNSGKIFSRGSDNKTIRYWHYEVYGDRWRGHYGVVGGKDAVSGWSVAKATNVNRANERNVEQQALFEAEAEYKKKLAREYRVLVEDLHGVPAAVMLAADYTKLKKALPTKGVSCQPKFDGIRLVASKLGGHSRDFQPFGGSIDHIRRALAPVFEKYPDALLDGELYNHVYHDDFNAMSSLVRKKKLTSAELTATSKLLEYHVYDMPSVLGGFDARSEALFKLFDEFDLDLGPLVLAPTYHVRGQEHLDELYEMFLSEGYEGQMVRLDAPYGFGVRSPSLMKRKVYVTEEFEVVRVIEGNGNWAGYAKAVEFRMPSGALTEGGELPKCGLRGTQEFAAELLRRDPPPRIVTVRHLGLTPGGVPRGPVAIDFDRED